MKYVLASLGNVFPTATTELRLHEIIGIGVGLVALYVVYRSLRQWRRDERLPLPVALIAFAFMFDVSIALGRLSLGVSQALSSRYTMANLTVLIAILCYGFSRSSRAPARGGHGRWAIAVAVGLCALVAVQFAVSTSYGLHESRITYDSRILEARTIVNFDRIPAARKSALVSAYVFISLPAVAPWIAMLARDHLSVFAPGQYPSYRAQGPP
jgi:hypothetical protein